MENQIETIEKKKLKCPECEEEIDYLELEVQTTLIKRLKPGGNGGNWDSANPVKQYEDDVNPTYIIVCPKCDHEFLWQKEPFNSDEKFDETEKKILNGTFTQEDLEAIY